jgi:hypothetical protein
MNCPFFVRKQGVKRCKMGQKWRLSLQDLLGLILLPLYRLPDSFSLITQRSVVQIHPPQPKNSLLSAISTNPATIRIDNPPSGRGIDKLGSLAYSSKLY